MKRFFAIQVALTLAQSFSLSAHAGDDTNPPTPVTARDFYNAGTKLLAAKKFPEAEKMFESALVTQDERVQPAAVYNLGHTRFDDGVDLLHKGPDAQKTSAKGDGALATGAQAIRDSESALAQNDLNKLVTAYLEGRGARRNLRDAGKAVQDAMDTAGKTLRLWQRSADDFKSASDLNPSDTNATHNAEIVERAIAKLVDSIQKMQAMSSAMGGQRQDLQKLLAKMKGKVPSLDAQSGAGGDEEDDDQGTKPDSLAGQKENAGRDGEQMQIPLSPDTAGQILDGLSLNGTRRLEMSDKEGQPTTERKGRNW